jgi:CubicO group peptidase (beta-lactamase class C family)
MLPQDQPPVRDDRVSAQNWLEAPFNRWSMWHLSELLPTERISRGTGAVLELPYQPVADDLASVMVPRIDGSRATVSQVLEETYTDAFAVLQGGQIVTESFASGGGPQQVHAALSITKSLVGCVAGTLIDRGVLDEGRDVVGYIPELGHSGYAGATVRHLLDMRSGARFLEDYADPDADVRRMDTWVVGHGRRSEQGLYGFLESLEIERPHGGPFLYRSSETDVLGWACERASGERMADLISALVWAPMGAASDAEIFCDRTGTAVHDGGLSATAADLLRFGYLLLSGGSVQVGDGESRAVLPPAWLRQAWAVNSDVRMAFLQSPAERSFPGGWYRNQMWFRPGEFGDVLLCLGIHGQMLHVSRRTGTVCVKLSSWPDAQNLTFLQDTLRACDAIGGALMHREPTGDTHRLPGIVSGLSRTGSDSRRRGGSIV